jgi:hypothetical protein
MAVTLSSANIWSLWSGHGGQGAARFFAAAVPVAGRHSLWLRWFPAPRLMTRRTPVGRVAGVPVNRLRAAATTAAAAGWFIDRRIARVSADSAAS